ncbi:MAG: hypothetical protein HGB26_01535 [Desulfobulbaceae bacterium]|nr:hypothetical protein [Desulfobulbaceae bacterium]
MSSLIFYTNEENAIIATDTLAVGEEGLPRQYTSKAVLVPHLRLVIAGTGVGGFSSRWFAAVNDNMIVRGLDHLDYHAPENLRRLFANFQEEIGFPDTLTTTIYHIGISEVTGNIHSYAYRSEKGFASDRLGYGMRVKPECVVPENYELPFDIVQMMESQRAIQAQKTSDTRLYIGGEIQVIQIERSSFHCYRLHRFDDFTATEDIIYSNYTRRVVRN